MSSPKQPTIELPLPTTLAIDRSATTRTQDEVLILFDACSPRLRRYIRSFGCATDVTEDVLQEVFLSLFRHLRLGRPRNNLPAWLFRVAHNLALKQRQKVGKRQSDLVWDTALVDRVIDPGENPEERMAQDERQHRLRAVLRTLPERDRRCVYLRAEGLRYRDIAKVLGISLGSVAKSLTRAIARLTNADEE